MTRKAVLLAKQCDKRNYVYKVVAIIRSQEGCIHTQYTNTFLSQSCIISYIFLYIYARVCRPRNIGPPSKIHNTWQRKMMKNKERSHLVPKRAWRNLEWCCAPNRFARANVLRQLFPFNEIIHFKKFILMFLHITFRFQSGSSKTNTCTLHREWMAEL